MPRVPGTSAGSGQTAEARRAQGPFGADRDPSARRQEAGPSAHWPRLTHSGGRSPSSWEVTPQLEPRGPSHRAAGVKAQEAGKMDTLTQCFEQTELIF